MAGADAGAAIHRRQAEARSDHQGWRTHLAKAPRHRSQRRHQAGADPRRAAGLVARPDAGAQAAHARGGRPGQQDGADRLGLAGQGRDLPGSGAGGLIAVSPEASKRKSDEGGYGAQSVRRDRETQGFPPCLEHAKGDVGPVRELPYRPAPLPRRTTGRTDGSIRRSAQSLFTSTLALKGASTDGRRKFAWLSGGPATHARLAL